MYLNFFYTGGPWWRQYTLAIETAIAVHRHTRAVLWCAENPGEIGPESAEKNPWEIEGLDLVFVEEKHYRALENQEEHFQRVHRMDALQWEILAKHGGILLGLDTYSLSDITPLLGDADCVVPMDVPNIGDTADPFGSAVLVFSEGSVIASWCHEEAQRRLQGDNFSWGDTGPGLISEAIRLHPFTEIVVPPFRMLGGFGGNEIASYLDSGNPPLEEHVRVIHWFRTAIGPNRFDRIKDHRPLRKVNFPRKRPSNSMKRLHLIGLPHTQVSHSYLSCAYSQKVLKFCKMMGKEYEVILYAGEHSEVENVTECVQLISEEERTGWFGDGFDTVLTPLLWDPNEPYWKTANERAIPAIKERISSDQDLLLLIGGNCQKPIADEVPLVPIEWGVGYEGIFCNFVAFESYAWMHHVYGKQNIINGRAFDAVIPNFFDPDDFRAPEGGWKKQDYLLFIGRVIERKGPHIAAEIAKRAGKRLIIAGPGAEQVSPGKVVAPEITIEGDHVEYVGEVGVEERARLMGEAAAVMAPTIYVEPFGGVAVEAMLAGTPVIASDWGSFTESVVPGVSGERFHTIKEGVAAVEKLKRIDPEILHQHAMRYSLESVYHDFDHWFNRIYTLWGQGYYA